MATFILRKKDKENDEVFLLALGQQKHFMVLGITFYKTPLSNIEKV